MWRNIVGKRDRGVAFNSVEPITKGARGENHGHNSGLEGVICRRCKAVWTQQQSEVQIKESGIQIKLF